MVNEETRTVPKSSLAFLFPGGFNEFWAKTAIKQDLEQIIYEYIPATETTEELRKTLASGGYGLLARPIAKHFFDRYQFRTYEPYEDIFVSTFKTNIISVVVEVRRKEHLLQDTYRQIKNFVKKLNLTTDTRTSKNYDQTKIDSGNIINKGSNTNQTNEQKQINSQSIPIFANVDLTSGNFGGFQRQSQLANRQTEQGQNIQLGTSNRTTSKQNLTSKDYFRSSKDANVQITKQDAYELANVGKLLNNFVLTVIKLSDYYPLFEKLFIKFFGATVVPIIDEKTGKRKWVSEAEYEELVEPEETAKPKIPDANEWDETLPYLKRLKIFLNKNEKEYSKLPDTSNRKPRRRKNWRSSQ